MRFLCLIIFWGVSVVAIACAETQSIPDGPIITPTFDSIDEFMLVPANWEVQRDDGSTYKQIVISYNGASIVITTFSDEVNSTTLKNWAYSNKNNLEKSQKIPVYSIKSESICLRKNMVKAYSLSLEGPDGKNSPEDRIEMYRFNIRNKNYYVNLWAGDQQSKEWQVMHGMLALSKLNHSR